MKTPKLVGKVKCTGQISVIDNMDGPQDKENKLDTSENTKQETANIVSNMALAHELLMNDSFKLQSELPENS